ncbi:MAG: succinate dehydrogenase, cytochrome b556 subunit [Gammaproteobacteria bacterium]|nr:succinate dehydrogenase, cytochrome b556 subunit [Gammaproteobacteria bacterium]MBU1646636.1 succinate dehydrogenase, cytochrome b556 subunit [Gammaproteobacteria bacterium]MBU1972893.1 succinate dehydrogenase, cytochrome b556 subunit [Gammaproteobacteria bacterium]
MPELARKRPKFLNLFAIRLPLAGYASIFHRVSGIGLFLMLPLLIWLLDRSLSTPEAYAQFQAVFDCWLVKLVLLGLLWSFLHHFCMGIRILLLDVHVGIDKLSAHNSAIAVMAVSLLLTAILGAKLLGIY